MTTWKADPQNPAMGDQVISAFTMLSRCVVNLQQLGLGLRILRNGETLFTNLRPTRFGLNVYPETDNGPLTWRIELETATSNGPLTLPCFDFPKVPGWTWKMEDIGHNFQITYRPTGTSDTVLYELIWG